MQLRKTVWNSHFFGDVQIWRVLSADFVILWETNYDCWLFLALGWSLCSIWHYKELQRKDKQFCTSLRNVLSCCAKSSRPEQGTQIQISSFALPPDSPNLSFFKVSPVNIVSKHINPTSLYISGWTVATSVSENVFCKEEFRN